MTYRNIAFTYIMPKKEYKKKWNKSSIVKTSEDKTLKKFVDKEIKKMLHVEKKQAGVFTTTPVTLDYSSPTIVGVNVPSTLTLQQGTQRNQRVGDIINISEFTFGMLMQISASATANNDSSFRVVIVYVKDSGGTTPQATDVFFNVAASITAMSPLLIDTVPSKYRVLHDQIYTLHSGSSGIATVNNSARSFVVHKKYKQPLKTTFVTNSTSTGVAAIDQGLILAYIVSGGATNNTIIAQELYSNIVYTDA